MGGEGSLDVVEQVAQAGPPLCWQADVRSVLPVVPV
jgi:hypothetical protein